MGSAKRGELKGAARILGVAGSTLRQHGWSSASPQRVQPGLAHRPDWLIAARENQSSKRLQRWRRRERRSTAGRLGVRVRAVTQRDVAAADVDGLLAAPPDWLLAEQRRRPEDVERQANDAPRGELTDTLIGSVVDVWLQELKRASTDAGVDAIDARWAPQVDRAKQRARWLVEALTGDQVRARVDRDDQAAREAARYRAAQLARRAFADDHGR
jgi:hypothetical protein